MIGEQIRAHSNSPEERGEGLGAERKAEPTAGLSHHRSCKNSYIISSNAKHLSNINHNSSVRIQFSGYWVLKFIIKYICVCII